MRLRGIGELYEGKTALGAVEYELEFQVRRDGTKSCSGRVKPRGWKGNLPGRPELLLRLEDGTRFEVESPSYNQATRWNVVHGPQAPRENNATGT
jgi:hypothetical protein